MTVHRFSSPGSLAASVAKDLVAHLAAIQAQDRVPSVVLTGGTIAGAIHLAVPSLASDVDWSTVDFWWGDERFVPWDDPDRNSGQAVDAMLDLLEVAEERVHAMPASDGPYPDPDAAAAAYAAELVGAAPADGPWFDVLMLGIGEDAHCASLFPGRHEMYDARPAVAVLSAPKPPPTRITLTMATLRRAREVWFVASGEGKAEAVAAAMSSHHILDVPSAGPRGLDATHWYLDEPAAWML